MDFSTLTSLSGEDLTTALALDVETLDNDALAAALTERKAYVAAAIALPSPTVAEVNAAEAVFATIKDIETQQAERAAKVEEAGNRFAALKTEFAASDDAEDEADDAEEEAAEVAETDDGNVAEHIDGTGQGADDGAGNRAGDFTKDAGDSGDADGGEAVTTAAATDHTRDSRVKTSAAKAVGRKTTRPTVATSRPVTMTASADVQGFGAGQVLDGMDAVAKALLSRIKGFPAYNKQAAKSIRSQNGGASKPEKFGVAAFGLSFPETLVASGTPGNEYGAMKRAIEDHQKAILATLDKGEVVTAAAMTAAGWCAPSPIAYNYISDYVVDGLLSTPEVNAPRGGLMLTTGPAKSSQGQALTDFGWTQTEAQANARTPKTFETIECPSFVDHRLDAIGYGVTIPILTEKAYPELVADTLKFANVLWAHKVNARKISDIVALSDTVAFNGYGPSFTDALEALALIAVKERRKWNIGVNAVMEVKLPVWAQEVFRADMSRRAAVAFDSVSDGQIAKHFSDRHLAVEYIADWQERTDVNVVLPGSFTALIYPSGTFVTVLDDVINLSAVYDAASLTVNEYLGVFFEQAYMTVKAGYGSSKVSIPVNTAGEMGALTLAGIGDHHGNGSF